MFEDVVKKILETIGQESLFQDEYPEFSGEGYRSHRIDIKNFHEIKKTHSGKRIAFVDGGNAEIIRAGSFSLNLIRVAYVIYQSNIKLLSKKFEVFAFVHTMKNENEIYYRASFFAIHNEIKLDEVSFNSFDHTLMQGTNRAEIGTIANALRRFAELELAKRVSDEKIADYIVLDGNMQCTMTNENTYMNELFESCSRNNVIVAAISKTSSLCTNQGNLLTVVLDNISKLSRWAYHPIADILNFNHKAEIFFVKLHSNSKHIFRFEIFNAQKDYSQQVLETLASNSVDPILIGYPYGLIEADRISRVSNQEKESLKTMFLVKLKHKHLGKYLSSVNAHEILDNISF